LSQLSMSSKQVELARAAIEAYIKNNNKILPSKDIPEELKDKAGVFVSIHKNGELRGCIGTFAPTQKNIAEEIIANAIAASTQDPRFPAITEEELPELELSVDVLTNPEPVKDVSELDSKKYGIIVTSRGRRGLLLPDLEWVDTPAQQIEICRRKAWINENDPITIEKFQVRRFH
jgi:MEMO1 family protein